jgi:hypothetical protein
MPPAVTGQDQIAAQVRRTGIQATPAIPHVDAITWRGGDREDGSFRERGAGIGRYGCCW